MSFEEEERMHCETAAAAWLESEHHDSRSAVAVATLLIRERALAREQQVSITTYALREREIAKADLVTAKAKLAAIEALCVGPATHYDGVNIRPYVLVADVRRILGGEP